MRKAVRDRLNNITWVKSSPRIGSTRPRYFAQLSDEWQKREFFLEKKLVCF